MSQENVDLTRRAFQAFHDRDLDALLAMLDDDVEAFPFLAGMEGGYRGHDGIAPLVGGPARHLPGLQRGIVELHDLGDSTMAVLRMRGHGAESDTPFDAAAWHVSHFQRREVHRLARLHQGARGPRSRGAVGVAVRNAPLCSWLVTTLMTRVNRAPRANGTSA